MIGAGTPGPRNAITDVPGVRVGHRTLVTGSGPLIVGQGPVRTGVTVILAPGDVWTQPVFAGSHRLNGNGEMTGLEWVRESGMLTTPVALTNTHSVGVVRDALLADRLIRPESALPSPWALPVVAETWDGVLNDLNGFHVRPEHVHEAIAAADGGSVPEGAVGAGTGMICHGFKGGIGSASRVCGGAGGATVGVLVLANHGRRERLQVNGVAVAGSFADVPVPADPYAAGPGAGSIIVVVATDAPLLPHQCTRLAQRAGLGVARTGGTGEHTSGDLFLCFATGNRGMTPGADVPVAFRVMMLADARITDLFDAVIESTEEAIVNAMLAAATTEGRDGIVARGLSGERLAQTLGARAAY
ncbi:MAG TPA: P1 family peptidase [Solirubrobacteraceae bacterium]|jgi:D-aminopeptidase|nr:P1 family peptidase [Solirubrobacteraceae bacterium]